MDKAEFTDHVRDTLGSPERRKELADAVRNHRLSCGVDDEAMSVFWARLEAVGPALGESANEAFSHGAYVGLVVALAAVDLAGE
jgi:hypothetical protein